MIVHYNRSDVSYIMVTYHPVEGLIATTTKGRPSKLPVENGNDPKSLYDANKLSGNKKMLLIFLFASDEELRLLMMHPELLVCDTTFKTNKQKKELFTVAGLDGNNEAFNGARAFLPSAKRWVFNILISHCLPLFWRSDVPCRVCLFLTDGDTHEYSAVIKSIEVCATVLVPLSLNIFESLTALPN